jgi:hypothetical protein
MLKQACPAMAGEAAARNTTDIIIKTAEYF